MKVLILTEGGRKTGFGHISRCIALSSEFESRGITSKFIINGDRSVASLLKDKKVVFINWLKMRSKIFKLCKNADIIIIDSYLADANFYKSVYKLAKLTVCMDDNNRLEYPPGVVINGNLYAKHIDYPKHKGVRYLLGPEYLPMAKDFKRARKKRLSKRIKKIMITFGGKYLDGVAPKVINFLNEELPDSKKYLIIGNAAFCMKPNEYLIDDRVNLFCNANATKMKEIMLGTDLAISGGGYTLHELAKVGVPTIAASITKNQELNLKSYKDAGFIEYAGFYKDGLFLERLKSGIKKLLPTEERLIRCNIGKGLIGDNGAVRAVDFILYKYIKGTEGARSSIPNGKYIMLRKAKAEDCYSIWLWRNSPTVRKNSANSGRINYNDHKPWFFDRLNDKNYIFYIAQTKEGRKIGQVRFDINRHKKAWININLNPAYLFQGWGNKIINVATETFLGEKPSISTIYAKMFSDNIASKKAFKKAGYKFEKSAFINNRKIDILNFRN